MDQAFESRRLKLGFLVFQRLTANRNDMVLKMGELNSMISEVQAIRQEIEEETRETFSGMIGRLESCEKPKMALLAAQIHQAELDINNIENTIQTVQELSRSSPVALLSKLPVLKENINYMITKPFEKEISETPNDLPRELYFIRRELEDADNFANLLAFKNEIIFSLTRLAKKEREHFNATTGQQMDGELNDWIEMAERQEAELSQYKLVCHFCSDPMTPENCNDTCLVNRVENSAINGKFLGFCKDSPPEANLRNRFHFFGKPNPEVLANPKLLNLMNNHVYKPNKLEDPYTEALVREIQVNVNHIRKRQEKTKVDLKEIFELFDELGLKVINSVTLKYILSDYLGVVDTFVDPIIKMMDPFKRDLVNYEEFLALLADPGYISQLPYFTYAEHSVEEGYQMYTKKFDAFHQAMVEKELLVQKKCEAERERYEAEQKKKEEEEAKKKKDGQGARAGGDTPKAAISRYQRAKG